jgi:FAD/FMN-containing dehydrogenase
MAELGRLAAARGVSPEAIGDPESELGPLREIVDLAAGGTVVRAALPLSAQVAFAEAAARSDRGARLVADAASGIAHVLLLDDERGIAAADALLANARVLGGSARVERTAVAGLDPFGGPEPSGAFLMRRLKDAFDPNGILEPARSALG